MQVVSVPVLGVALFAILGVAVQSGAAIVVDRVGLSPSGKRDASFPRIMAAIACWGAVVITGWDRIGSVRVSLIVLLGVVLANVATTVKGAINARVAVAVDSALAATVVSFGLGTVVLAITYALRVLFHGTPAVEAFGAWWVYSGGAIGAFALFLAVLCISKLGVLLFGVCGVAGQMFGSLVLDRLSPIASAPVSPFTLVGAALTLFAIALAAELGILKGVFNGLTSVWDIGGDPR